LRSSALARPSQRYVNAAGADALIAAMRDSRGAPSGLTRHIRIDIVRRKPIRWLGDSLNRVRDFSKAARRRAGIELRHVQHGEQPSDWKPVATVGAGAVEIRVHVEGEYRVLYVAKFAETVYVLHAFEKKSRRTPRRDIDLAAKRYRQMMAERRAK
jgi:phage-related protein